MEQVAASAVDEEIALRAQVLTGFKMLLNEHSSAAIEVFEQIYATAVRNSIFQSALGMIHKRV